MRKSNIKQAADWSHEIEQDTNGKKVMRYLYKWRIFTGECLAERTKERIIETALGAKTYKGADWKLENSTNFIRTTYKTVSRTKSY